MAVFSQNINQLSGDPVTDIKMLYDHVSYMQEAIERAHSETIQGADAVNRSMAAAAAALSGKEVKTNG